LDITQESFDALLRWLDPDRDVAGQKYETIRQGLIRIFNSKGISKGEMWADETIDRVARNLPEVYQGDPTRYFVGFARNIIHEARRPREIATDDFLDLCVELSQPDETLECLVQCLKFFSKKERDLILDYYAYSGHDKIEVHQQLAAELKISRGALRNRVFQISTRLQKAVLECVASRSGNKNSQERHS
jgi:DNA-directed RNA polymerase specialized sigma24 family protein